MRKLLRLLFVTLAGTLIFTIISGVVGEFFIELAREKDWYTNPSQQLDAVMGALVSFVAQSWFLITTALIVGLAAGMWIDTILRRREVQLPTAVTQPRQMPQPGAESTNANQASSTAQTPCKFMYVDFAPTNRASRLRIEAHIATGRSVPGHNNFSIFREYYNLAGAATESLWSVYVPDAQMVVERSFEIIDAPRTRKNVRYSLSFCIGGDGPGVAVLNGNGYLRGSGATRLRVSEIDDEGP